MYQPRKIENKYGDLLYLNCTFLDCQDEYSPDQPVALKMYYPIPLPFYDFSFVFFQDGHYIYLNTRAKKELPPMNTNGFIESSIVVFCCIVEEKRYYLLVKDKYKGYLTCPGGSKIFPEESFLQCAIRELQEETSIECSSLKEFGMYEHRHCMFSMNLNGLTKIFYGQMNFTKEQLDRIQRFKSNEIEKVFLIPSWNLDSLIQVRKIVDDKIYRFYKHHIVFMKYMEMYYQKENYHWLNDIDESFRPDLFLY
jgi:ADP-ribose pyrophosphatase YjhB (NUDIX family)